MSSLSRSIKIVPENKDKIANALSVVQSKCTMRTITADDVFNAVERTDKLLSMFYRKYLNGTEVTIDSCPFSNGYYYGRYPAPSRTFFTMRYRNGSWSLTDVYRGEHSIGSNGVMIKLGTAAVEVSAATIARNFCDGFGNLCSLAVSQKNNIA